MQGTLLTLDGMQYDWTQHSLCRGRADDFFYEERYRVNSKKKTEHIQMLRDMCKRCPVRRDCRNDIDPEVDITGFRAGMTAEERRRFFS
jgi:hypothetical protein